ncbi:MAG: hypothetical protein II967_06205 [Deltaproteobacteria bacterium]|nr:hypothetical protein [Deltaproteobacteria bacterium]
MTAITTGVQLQQYLETGGYVQLNSQGALETQSGISRFFQKIGDAFRGLSASGQQALADRNTRLQDAMASMLRQQGVLPNLGETRIASTSVKGGVEQAILLRMAVSRMVSGGDSNVAVGNGIPASDQKGVQEAVLKYLEYYPPADRSLQGMRAKAGRILTNFLTTPGMLKACKTSFTVDPGRATAIHAALHQSISDEYLKEQDHTIDENGFHNSYLLDAVRGDVASINGQPLRTAPLHPDTNYLDVTKPGSPSRPPNEQGILEQMADIIPDKKIRGFVTMLASQAGIEGSLSIHLATGTPPADDEVATLPDLIPIGMAMEFPKHKYALNVSNDGVLHVTCNLTAQNTVVQNTRTGVPPLVLASNAYEVVVNIPLNQDMTDKDVPDFTVSGFRHV